MYVPPQFREEDVPTLHALIRAHSLATLVTCGPDGLEANHIPMEVDTDPVPYGTLRGHVARANPVWQSYAKDVHALAIFVGPQTYITPSWYKTKGETGKVVPTWNYAVRPRVRPARHRGGPDLALQSRRAAHARPRGRPAAGLGSHRRSRRFH
jgi:transcriptional regulator